MKEGLEMLEHLTDSIPTYAVANSIATRAVESHRFQWKLYRSIEEHIAGKKPIPREKLQKQGLDWASNWNFGKARSQIERNVADQVKKISDSLSIGSPEFKIGKDEDKKNPKLQFLFDFNHRGAIASTLGYCFSRALEEDGDLYNWINKTEYYAYTFGFAPVSWDTNSWMPIPIDVSRIAFHPGSTTRDTNCWVIFRTESAQDLYDTYVRIKNKQATQEAMQSEGVRVPPLKYYWDTNELEKILVKLFSGKRENGGIYETWADILPIYRESPGSVVSQTEDLNIACIYKVEADGSITVVYIPWGYSWCDTPFNRNGNKADDTAKIIYKRVHKNKSWKELLIIIQDSAFTETGDIHTLRGTGKQSVENSIRYNRLRNSINNKSELIGSPMFEQPSTQTGEKMKITHSQGFTLLQPGFVPLENQPTYDINSHLAIMNAENREFDTNNAHFESNATGKLSSRPTSDEVQLAKSESTRIQHSKDLVKLRDYSGLFYHMMKLMASTSPKKGSIAYAGQQKFFKLVKQQLPSICETDQEVRDLINLVDGYSIDMVNTSISSLQMAMQLAETPYARNRIKRMMLITEGFSVREVNVMVPLITDKFRSFDDTRVALIENDMFWTTDEVSFSETDDHTIHYGIHSGKLDQTFEKTRAGQLDVVVAYDYAVKLYSHIFLHIEDTMRDPVLKGVAEDWMDEMRQRKKVIDQLSFARSKEIARREEAAAQANPGISPKDQHDMRLKEAQAQASEARNQFKTAQRGQLKMEEIKMKQALAKQELDNEHQIELRRIELENQREMQKQ